MGIRDAAPIRGFRTFRWTRPFWGALFVGAGGLIIGALPLGPTDDLIHVGYGLFAGEVCAVLLLAMAAVLLFFPEQRKIAAVVAVLASLASFPLSNLGGFVIGMMAGIIGGSLAFGWVPDKKTFARVVDSPPDHRPRPFGRPGVLPPDNDNSVKESVFTGGNP